MRMPLSSVLSPLLRRGERKQKRVATNLRRLRKLLCRAVQIDTNKCRAVRREFRESSLMEPHSRQFVHFASAPFSGRVHWRPVVELRSLLDRLHVGFATAYFPLTLREREQEASGWCLADGRWQTPAWV